MYAKLIFKNAKRSVKDYLIYIVTMTLCVTLFYAFLSISSTHYHPTIGAEYNISLLAGGMKLAICGISLLLLFLMQKKTTTDFRFCEKWEWKRRTCIEKAQTR